MLRDKNLIPLSHQHQHALALCVRLDRALPAGEVDREAWQAEIAQIWEAEIAVHFAAEESVLFPAAAHFPELESLTETLRQEHSALRDLFSRAAARDLDVDGLRSFAEKLSAHIRKEERQLFEGMQKRMSSKQLAGLGTRLERALADVSKVCLIPTQATWLRTKLKP